MANVQNNSVPLRNPWKFCLHVPLLSKKFAKIVCNSLRIDSEPNKSDVSKEFIVEENILKM